MNLFKRSGVALLVLTAFSLSACAWAGETAGRAQAGVERAVKDTQDGYHKGYEHGKKGE